MAKSKKDFVLDKYGGTMFVRQEQYAQRVKARFDNAVSQLVRLAEQVKGDYGDSPFSFDDNPRIRKETQKVIQRLYTDVYGEIKNGCEAEWEYANLSCDALVRSVFDWKPKEQNLFARYFERNRQALDAFYERTTSNGGLNLSQKVWKYTGDFKREMEGTITACIGEGMSAAQMSRQVRQYLNEPDKLFRRVRGADGELHLSKNAKMFHPGQGVYRSSYKNAMRLTRTETNAAYRAADEDRWMRMDFVVGIEIKKSNNHPDDDICDMLCGKYPKDFKYTAWHPQCRCYVVPILATPKEIAEYNKAILNGEDNPVIHSENAINGVPRVFSDWLNNNQDRIKTNGYRPYFIADNVKYTGKYLTHAERKEAMAIDGQIARRRHAMRNDDAVRAMWEQRHPVSVGGLKPSVLEAKQKRLASRPVGYREDVLNRRQMYQKADALLAEVGTLPIDKKMTDLMISLRQERFSKTGTLISVGEKHGELMVAVENKKQILQKASGNVSKVADKYLYSADISKAQKELEALSKGTDYVAINNKTKELAKLISAEKKDNAFLSQLIPDVEKWKGKYTSKELHDTFDAVKARMATMSHSSASSFKHDLDFEAQWVEDHKKYKTWEVAQSAYKKASAESAEIIKWEGHEKDWKLISASIDKTMFADEISKVESAILSRDEKIFKSVTKGIKEWEVVFKDIADLKSSGVTTTDLADLVAKRDLKKAKDEIVRLQKEKIRLEKVAKNWTEVKDVLAEAKTFKTKSKPYLSMVTELESAIASNDLQKAQDISAKMQKKRAELAKKFGAPASGTINSGETIEQLVKRLGNDCPESLKNMAKILKDYEGEYFKKYAKTEAEQKEIEAWIGEIKKAFDKYDFGMRINPHWIENSFDEHFKNLVEVGHSGGASSVPLRRKNESLWFGIDQGADAKEFTKYGCLMDKDISTSMKGNSAGWYGTAEVRFKKDKVNCTWTWNDSLDHCQPYDAKSRDGQPSLVTDPKPESLGLSSWDRARNKPDTSGSAKEFFSSMGSSYLELQYHGELTFDAVQSVAFKGKADCYAYESAIKKITSANVDVFCYDSGELKKVVFDANGDMKFI